MFTLLKILIITISLVHAATNIDITEDTIDKGLNQTTVDNVRVQAGVYWSVDDVSKLKILGNLENYGELYVTSAAKKSEALDISGESVFYNEGIALFDSTGSENKSSRYEFSGTGFQNFGDVYFGTSGNDTSPETLLAGSTWINYGTLNVFKNGTSDVRGRLSLGRSGLLVQNYGQICLYNHHYTQLELLQGGGCITLNNNSRIELDCDSGADTQVVVLADSKSELVVSGYSKCTVKVVGYGNGNKLMLSDAISSSSIDYDAQSGILTLKTKYYATCFDIGFGYDDKLFKIDNTGNWYNALIYTGSIPTNSTTADSCLPCKYPFPQSPSVDMNNDGMRNSTGSSVTDNISSTSTDIEIYQTISPYSNMTRYMNTTTTSSNEERTTRINSHGNYSTPNEPTSEDPSTSTKNTGNFLNSPTAYMGVIVIFVLLL